MSLTSTAADIMPMSIYTVLKGEHREVSMLIKTLEMTPNADAGRTGIFEKMRRELRSHSEAEEIAVYDKLKQREGAQELMAESEMEHKLVDRLLDELHRMDKSSEAWLPKLAELKANLDKHVEKEETVTFDKLKTFFSDEEAKAMADEFQTLKNAKLEALRM